MGLTIDDLKNLVKQSYGADANKKIEEKEKQRVREGKPKNLRAVLVDLIDEIQKSAAGKCSYKGFWLNAYESEKFGTVSAYLLVGKHEGVAKIVRITSDEVEKFGQFNLLTPLLVENLRLQKNVFTGSERLILDTDTKFQPCPELTKEKLREWTSDYSKITTERQMHAVLGRIAFVNFSSNWNDLDADGTPKARPIVDEEDKIAVRLTMQNPTRDLLNITVNSAEDLRGLFAANENPDALVQYVLDASKEGKQDDSLSEVLSCIGMEVLVFGNAWLPVMNGKEAKSPSISTTFAGFVVDYDNLRLPSTATPFRKVSTPSAPAPEVRALIGSIDDQLIELCAPPGKTRKQILVELKQLGHSGSEVSSAVNKAIKEGLLHIENDKLSV